MGGHVNMMDDVLISNLSPDLLRSSLRQLISLCRENRQAFLKHTRGKLEAAQSQHAESQTLFPEPNVASEECLKYLTDTRCLLSAQMPFETLSRLTHFCQSITMANASWTPGSELEGVLETFSGDIVQSMQALKESGLPADDHLKQQLQALAKTLVDCKRHCLDKKPEPLTFPLRRALRQVYDVYSFFFPSASALDAVDDADARIEINPTSSSHVETVKLGQLQFPRLLNGFWQLSSPAWGSASAESQDEALKALVEAGLTAADMADHYGDAELVYGSFRNRLHPDIQERVYAATKWCVFKQVTVPITESWVLQNVEARYRRLGGRVDLLQFHWYNYDEDGWLFILESLVRLTKSRPDLVRAIGLCNFDSQRTEEVCEHLLRTTGEVGIVSNQVQFSLVDSRPLQKMSAVCEKYGLKLLTYGSFSGGLVSERWIGAPAPEPYSASAKLTPSQRKYYDMVMSWGTWTEFQELLRRLATVGSKHKVSLTVVASRWVLQQPAVGAVIVGTRLGVSMHGNENLHVFDFTLSEDDLSFINEAALGKEMEKSRALYSKIGDCGHEYHSVY
ncbi:hypothetical protein NLU13_1147 [Sarocladium strictum]|uniref:NADP-dependent oxidoreductase domain-containing protein n=1 Tax=Sarocladium strictum TaxID=5046 RepID=A0AA39GRX5_SARSR|nr:hypothetical protein NLU13_1147 [Sarocladium strictum]